MKSYLTLRTLTQRLTKNSASAHLTEMDELINDDIREINALKDWSWLHRTRTGTTVASTASYVFPYDLDQLESVYITVSSRRYTPKIIHSRDEWDRINETTITSDIPQYAFVTNGAVEFYPRPATAGNTITFIGKVRVMDLNTTDYTTGTVDIITNGDETVTGSSSVWTTPMTGRWLRITHSDTAASSGDGHWYEISSRTSNTVLELVRKYGGTSLTTGAAASYIIGQIPLLPEAFHDMPCYKAAAIYWYNNNDDEKGDRYMGIYDRKRKILETQYDSQTTDIILDDGRDDDFINPNLIVVK